VKPAVLDIHNRAAGSYDILGTPLHAMAMNNYAGSVTFSYDGSCLAVSSPRGGCVQIYATETGHFVRQYDLKDACGVAPAFDDKGFIITTGLGHVSRVNSALHPMKSYANIQWDNHITLLT